MCAEITDTEKGGVQKDFAAHCAEARIICGEKGKKVSLIGKEMYMIKQRKVNVKYYLTAAESSRAGRKNTRVSNAEMRMRC